MKTVGDFKKAGLVFVIGDVCRDNHEYTYEVDWPESANNGAKLWDLDTLDSFAWRENTGEKPEFEGLIDFVHGDGEGFNCHHINKSSSCEEWDLSDHGGDIIKWRPHLPASIQTETPEEKEALNSMAESKPVFTQAMADAGELPPVGAEARFCWRSEFEDESFHRTLKVIAYNEDKTQMWAHMDNNEHSSLYNLNRLKFQPIKSEREEAIDKMIQLDCWATDVEFCEELYDANYRKLTPSQANAYDAKVGYFGGGRNE